MKNPPPGNQGLAFQTHALQMTLFGPFHVRTQHCYFRYEPCPYSQKDLKHWICMLFFFLFFFFFLFVEQKDIVDYINENLLCQPGLQKNKTRDGTSFIDTTKSKICIAMYAFFWNMYLYVLSYFLVHAWLKDHTFIYKCLSVCYNFILWSSFSWIYYNHERRSVF